jgi:hypothetical protein
MGACVLALLSFVQVQRATWFFEQGRYDKSNIAYPHTKPVAAIRLKV